MPRGFQGDSDVWPVLKTIMAYLSPWLVLLLLVWLTVVDGTFTRNTVVGLLAFACMGVIVGFLLPVTSIWWVDWVVLPWGVMIGWCLCIVWIQRVKNRLVKEDPSP
jgi:hypothetical protein